MEMELAYQNCHVKSMQHVNQAFYKALWCKHVDGDLDIEKSKPVNEYLYVGGMFLSFGIPRLGHSSMQPH